MLILHVGPKDMGEYTITAENALGQAECSTVLSVRGERPTHLHFLSKDRWDKKTTTYVMMLNHFISPSIQSEETTTI